MLPKNCQMLLFSATFEETVWNFAQRIVPDPNIIKLKREEETLDTIKQYYVLCNSKEEKFQALCNIYGAITIAQAMIFCHVSSFTSYLETWAALRKILTKIHIPVEYIFCNPIIMSRKPALQLFLESFSSGWRNNLAPITNLLVYFTNTFQPRPSCKSAMVAKLCLHLWLHEHLLCWWRSSANGYKKKF